MKILLLRNVYIGGKFFAEGEQADLTEKDARVLCAMKKARPVTAEDAGAIEQALREESRKALAGKTEAPEDKGGKKK